MWTQLAVQPRATSNAQATLRSSDISQANDAELVQALLADEARAWREFNTRFSRLISSTIGRVTTRFRGLFSQEDVREIYATFCVQLLANDKSKLRLFDPTRGNKLSTWLGLLASHTAYDYLRRARREPKRAALSEADDLCAPLPDPCESALLRERAQIVGGLLAGFSDKDQSFIKLYFGEGLTPEQVAERLGISVKTVYTKKHKIQARLRALLLDTQLAA
jgi:RNA polymerase sigma-70 factor (ECF subfamily)